LVQEARALATVNTILICQSTGNRQPQALRLRYIGMPRGWLIRRSNLNKSPDGEDVSMRALSVLMSSVVIGGIMYLIMRRNRERFTNAPLRDEIQARVCLSTPLDHVSILGTGGFRGTRGQWIRVKGPKRLEAGADTFMISLPGASREDQAANVPRRAYTDCSELSADPLDTLA
jgi:hypothetical protein